LFLSQKINPSETFEDITIDYQYVLDHETFPCNNFYAVYH